MYCSDSDGSSDSDYECSGVAAREPDAGPSMASQLHPNPAGSAKFAALLDRKSPMLITLEGNIGVGKTYLATELAKELGYKVFLEPTVKNPYLEKFYADPKGYALKLQVWIYRQRFKTYVAAVQHMISTGQGIILDRSVFSDKIFADANVVEGNITSSGYSHYLQLRNQSLAALPWPHVSVVLSATPEICNERIMQRSRDCESGIPVEYLRLLDDGHQTFLEDMSSLPSKVISVDWTTFGTAKQVFDVLSSCQVSQWTAEQVDAVKQLASTELLQNRALHVPNTPPEAVVEGDLSHELTNQAEEVLHLTERMSLTGRDGANSGQLTPGHDKTFSVPSSQDQALSLIPESIPDQSGTSTKRRLFRSQDSV